MFARTIAALTAGVLFAMPQGVAFAAAPAAGTIKAHPFQVIPFVGLLLSLAILQAAVPAFWHRYERHFVAGWSVLTLALLAVSNSLPLVGETVLATAVDEYIPFIVLIATLYIVAGGIRITGYLHGNPRTNLALLASGALLASLVGTTGAAMVMIRPLLRANEDRVHNAHVFVFFIFVVANIGGALTPLGDPPLLIGFLNGVGFFWTTEHLALPTGFVLVVLGLVFLVIDRHFYHVDEAYKATKLPHAEREGLGLEGWVNVGLMLVVVAAVPIIGLWTSPISFHIGHAEVGLPDVVRTLLLIAVSAASLILTRRVFRIANGFTWQPIAEVATVFAGIFITLAPVIELLREGEHGAFAPILRLVTRQDGSLSPMMFYWTSGVLSGVLDNAPTYLAFFNLAGGDAAKLMTEHALVLTALSCGCVFMGALTYVGNAPNMMVKTIARQGGVAMPGFLAYVAWASIILLPIFIVMSLIFFR